MKNKYIKIKVQDLGSYCIETFENIGNFIDILKDSNIGDIYEVSIVTMTEKEYKSLPEFMGF